MFSSWSLRGKLLCAFSSLALLLGITSVVSYVSLDRVSDQYATISDALMPGAQALSKMRFQAQMMNRGILRLALASTTQERGDLKDEYEAARKSFEAARDAYLKLPFLEGEEALYKKVESAFVAFDERSSEAVKISMIDTAEARSRFDELRRGLTPYRAALDETLEGLSEFQSAQAAIARDIATKGAQAAQVLSLALAGGGIVLAGLIGFLFANSLSSVLRRAANELNEASNRTAAASHQLSASGQQLASGSSECASSLEETVASLEELSSMVKTNAEHAREASALSSRGREGAETGEREIHSLIAAMAEISSGSKKIEEIISVIEDIAFQTNLLALNAAVEAARAGEQGKGFAVVAEAVRALAQRSSVAAKDISALIRGTVEKTQNGARVADKSGEVLREIVTSAKKVADLVNEISTASQEQANGLNQISRAMTQLDQATQTNAASAEEVASSSEEMSTQARRLQGLVSDLRAVVEGRGGHSDRDENRALRRSPEARPQPRQQGSGTPGKSSRTFAAKVKPSDAAQVIPFEDRSSDESEETMGRVGTTDGF